MSQMQGSLEENQLTIAADEDFEPATESIAGKFKVKMRIWGLVWMDMNSPTPPTVQGVTRHR